MSPYDILCIKPGSTQEEIKAAFRKKALETHPDRNPNDPKAAEKFRAVVAAYESIKDSKLSDPIIRQSQPSTRGPQPPPFSQSQYWYDYFAEAFTDFNNNTVVRDFDTDQFFNSKNTTTGGTSNQ